MGRRTGGSSRTSTTEPAGCGPFGRELGVRFFLAWLERMPRLGAGIIRTETDLIVKSGRVVPSRPQSSGFEFAFPAVADTVEDIAGLPKA